MEQDPTYRCVNRIHRGIVRGLNYKPAFRDEHRCVIAKIASSQVDQFRLVGSIFINLPMKPNRLVRFDN